MKYLKYLTEKIKQEDFYVEINIQEYDDLMDDNTNRERFNTTEVNFLYIRGLIPETDPNDIKYYVTNCFHVYYNPIRDSTKVYLATKGWLFLTKLKDSYYVVSCGSGCYKCDQWDGLVRFLKDKGII